MTLAVTRPIRWGIIGIGRFGRIHARALTSLPNIELVAISRRDPTELAKAAAELGVRRTYQDFRQLLEASDIDAVTICTHWRDHFEAATLALESGKHVLLEKPMASSSDECRRLLATAEAATGKFMVGHTCRFDPRVTSARDAIQAGRIGRIISMHAKRNLPMAPGHIRLDKISPLMGDGIHDADLMMWFLGESPSRVFARNLRVEQYTYPDVGWAMLEFADQAIGVIETNWRLPINTPTTIDSRIEVSGTLGQLTIDCANTGLSILDPQGLKLPDTAYWPQQFGQVVGALRNELLYFANCVWHDQEPAAITPREAARAVALMELAEQSAVCGFPVDVPASI